MNFDGSRSCMVSLGRGLDRLGCPERWLAVCSWLQAQEAMLAVAGIFSLAVFLVTLAAVPVLLVALPHDVFKRDDEDVRRRLALLYVPYLIVKNVIGVLLLIAGTAMLVLPGQGLLTIVLGLALVNFPGKKKLAHRILRHKRIGTAVTRLRARFHRPPFQIVD